MKLLFDQNLSPQLIALLKDLYPGSDHVFPLGLDQLSDQDIYEHARDAGFTVVTKEADFSDLYSLRGFPPKVIWIRRGNCTTLAIEEMLRTHFDEIATFEADPLAGVLALL